MYPRVLLMCVHGREGWGRELFFFGGVTSPETSSFFIFCTYGNKFLNSFGLWSLTRVVPMSTLPCSAGFSKCNLHLIWIFLPELSPFVSFFAFIFVGNSFHWLSICVKWHIGDHWKTRRRPNNTFCCLWVNRITNAQWPITNRIRKEWHDCNGDMHIEEVTSSLNMCTDELAVHFVLHATTHRSDTRVTDIWTMLLEGTGSI